MTDEELDLKCTWLRSAADEEIRAQAKVLFSALDIFYERDKVRGSLWKQAGIHDAAYFLKSKSMRIMAMMSSGVVSKSELHDEAVDEGLDAINYAVFYIRHLTGEL